MGTKTRKKRRKQARERKAQATKQQGVTSPAVAGLPIGSPPRAEPQSPTERSERLNNNEPPAVAGLPTEPRPSTERSECLHKNEPRSDDRKSTTLGTPCAKSWDAAWIAKVDAAEDKAGHRICGAKPINGDKPCMLQSDHPSGRCQFHGGFANTGAPEGNRNAQVHGLYTRQLMVCGQHCPMWDRCPLACREVAELPMRDRPVCPFEQNHYDMVVEDELLSAPDDSPSNIHLAHWIALLTVMVWRASSALSAQPLVHAQLIPKKVIGSMPRKAGNVDEDEPPKYTERPGYVVEDHTNASLDALIRLNRELERARRLMERRRQQRAYEAKHDIALGVSVPNRQGASAPCANRDAAAPPNKQGAADSCPGETDETPHADPLELGDQPIEERQPSKNPPAAEMRHCGDLTDAQSEGAARSRDRPQQGGG